MSESHIIEYKSSWRDEYLKWVCGFANANGGIIYVGKADDGKVVGVQNSEKLIEDIPNKIRSLMGIIAKVSVEGKAAKVVKVKVSAYPSPISYHGKYYIRSGATNQELSGAALDEFLLRKQGRTWDSVPVPFVKIKDLDIVAFREFRTKAFASGRLTKEDLNINEKMLIENLMLREGNYLKRAAILLFHNNPEKYFMGAYIKIGFFENDADLLYQDEVHGSIILMPDKVMDIIYSKYFKGIISYKGIQRVEKYPVPRDALREAILNAIVHRDYSKPTPIQIRIYRDKLIIFNDGMLPENWTIKNLLSTHKSSPHNPSIANTFFRSGMIETWGRGIDKIKNGCKFAEAKEPIFEYNFNEINVNFAFENNEPPIPITTPITTPMTAPTTPITTPMTAPTTPITTPMAAPTTPITTPMAAPTTPITTPMAAPTTPITTPMAAPTTPITTPMAAPTTPMATPMAAPTTPITTPNTSQNILEIIEKNPDISIQGLSDIIGITRDGVKWNIKKLKEQGIIRRIGTNKNGYWKISMKQKRF